MGFATLALVHAVDFALPFNDHRPNPAKDG
jgi:hypothetical protein